jgi:hypothetical protein
MPVYVDNMHELEMGRFGRMKMSHMVADTLEELHAMADRIGVARRWYQAPPKTRHPHYDIAMSKRAMAVAAGAVEVDIRAVPDIARACLAREKARADQA